MSATILAWWIVGAWVPCIWWPKSLGGRSRPSSAVMSMSTGIAVYALWRLL